jgi:hypothetical protein
MITDLCLFHLTTRRSPADHANPRGLLMLAEGEAAAVAAAGGRATAMPAAVTPATARTTIGFRTCSPSRRPWEEETLHNQAI